MKTKIIAKVCTNVALSSATLNSMCNRYLESQKKLYDNQYSYREKIRAFINDFLFIKKQLTNNIGNLDFDFNKLVIFFDSKYGVDRFNFNLLFSNFFTAISNGVALMRSEGVDETTIKQVTIRHISCMELSHKFMRYYYE